MTKARDIASAAPAPSTVDATEIGYLDGVTSAIQTQIDAKAPSSTAVTLTGTQTLTNKTLTNPVIASVVNNTLTSTTGDMIYASAANTPARLGIGSSAQVLTVAGGIPSWATPAAGGGMTLLSTTTLSGTSVTISSINQTYKHLFMVGNLISVSSGGENVGLRLNGNTGSNYQDSYFYFITSNHGAGSDNTANPVLCGYSATTPAYNANNNFNTWIYRYTETETKIIQNIGFASNNAEKRYAQIGFNSTSAITSITILTNGGHTFNNGTVYLYGVN
jgi:hypothetical protein